VWLKLDHPRFQVEEKGKHEILRRGGDKMVIMSLSLCEPERKPKVHGCKGSWAVSTKGASIKLDHL
jgi:hypothetical protein